MEREASIILTKLNPITVPVHPAGCPLTPDLTNTNFAIENVTYSCTTTTANSEACPYTCPDGFEPLADTDPVCIAAGWRFSWVQGTGGLPSCVSAAPAGEHAVMSTLKREFQDSKQL